MSSITSTSTVSLSTSTEKAEPFRLGVRSSGYGYNRVRWALAIRCTTTDAQPERIAFPLNIPPKQTGQLRVILVGDVVGKGGLALACDAVWPLRTIAGCDAVIVNAENAADGAGLTIAQYRRLIEAGVDAITLGDHIYKKREIVAVLDREPNIVKPANFPPTAPGKDHCLIEPVPGIRMAIVSLLGRVFTRPVDCPFLAIDRVLASLGAEVRIRVVDLHAEATSDKQSMGRYLDGRVSAVLGTHTHVATADEQIFPGGTAFQCDVGMTGPYESILGRSIEPVLNTTISFDPNPFHVAVGDVRLSGTWVDIDPTTGHATQIGRLQWTEAQVSEWTQQRATHDRLTGKS